jgi:hypothetical protein
MAQYNRYPDSAKSMIKRNICSQQGGEYKYKISIPLKFTKMPDGSYIIDNSQKIIMEVNNMVKNQVKVRLDSYLIIEEQFIGSDKILGMSFGEH